jgi:hypothetical protein
MGFRGAYPENLTLIHSSIHVQPTACIYITFLSVSHGHCHSQTVTVNLLKCPKKRPHGLPPDIRLSQLHLELPYMQNVPMSVMKHMTPSSKNLKSPYNLDYVFLMKSCKPGTFTPAFNKKYLENGQEEQE